MGTSFFACEVGRSWRESDESDCRVSICRIVCLTRDLVAALLGEDLYEPTGVAELLSLHETATGASHDFESLSTTSSVQQLLSTERHMAMYTQLRAKVSVRSRNLML